MYHEADNSVQCKCKLHVTPSMTIPPFISNQSMARKMIFILWFSEATVMTSDYAQCVSGPQPKYMTPMHRKIHPGNETKRKV